MLTWIGCYVDKEAKEPVLLGHVPPNSTRYSVEFETDTGVYGYTWYVATEAQHAPEWNWYWQFLCRKVSEGLRRRTGVIL